MDRERSDIYILTEGQEPEDKTLPRFIEWLKNGVIKIPRAEDRGDADGYSSH